MAHHNSRDCTRWPCSPTSSPWTGHHPEPSDGADDGTTSEARAEVQPPIRRKDDSE